MIAAASNSQGPLETPPYKYPIVEIFKSIQGEGCYMGSVVTFIRLAGCNLQCPWCDTDFTATDWKFADEIVKEVSTSKVVITGGEPTLHPLRQLCLALKKSDVKHIAIETNGNRNLGLAIGLVDWITCSPKAVANYYVHPQLIVNEYKFVVDEHFKVEDTQPFQYRGVPIWLQPEATNMEDNFKKCFEIAMENPTMRVGIQMHKLIGVR